MLLKVSSKLSQEFKKYNIKQIESGASNKKLFRLKKNNKSFILIDFTLDKNEYHNYLKIYELLKNINISVPKIIEKYDNNSMLVVEDFGDLRFDKILFKYNLKDLLKYAVDTLIIINKNLKFDKKLSLFKYDYNLFKSEITELPEYYFPYINLNDKNIYNEFLFIWGEAFKDINFEFNSFVHKDFNFNNLILIPNKKNHLKCGVIDFQNAFWGENSWDLFSLLEDSRILFTDDFNDCLIKYFFLKTDQNTSLENFNINNNFLNSSRQTRLLGRWVKLSKELNKNWYLEFIPITQERLKKSINFLNNKKITKFYNKYIFR